MIVSIGTSGDLALADAYNLKAFSFAADASLPLNDTDAVTFADGAAWISEAQLRGVEPMAGDPEWQKGLDAMIAFASTRGWIDHESGRIRAHIEPARPAPAHDR